MLSNSTLVHSESATTDELDKRLSNDGDILSDITTTNKRLSIVSRRLSKISMSSGTQSMTSQTLSARDAPHYTISEIIQKLTSPDRYDMEFTKIFLILYQKLMVPEEFLNQLFDRFDEQEGLVSSPDQLSNLSASQLRFVLLYTTHSLACVMY